MESGYRGVEQASFVWTRADAGYYWDTEATAQDGRTSGPFLVFAPDTLGFESYAPLEMEPTLFLLFEKLGEEPTRDEVEAFASKFGPLTRGIAIETKQRQGASGGPQTLMPLEGEPYMLWFREVREMRRVVRLWRWIEDKDLAALSEIIVWADDGSSVRASMDGIGRELASREHSPAVLARLHPGDVLLPAKLLLASWINAKLSGRESRVTPQLLLTRRNDFVSYMVPADLLAALWLQAFRAALGRRRFKQCAVCLEWEDVTEHTDKWTRHPKCANRDRVSRYRSPEATKKREARKKRGSGQR